MTQQRPNKLILSILMLAGTLLGCTNNASQPNYNLDSYTLGRSSVFTQRELINEQLKDPADINTEVRDALLNSYCDLIAQGAIYVSRDNRPQQCQIDRLSIKQRHCAYNYHICIKTCPLTTDDCQPCIKRTRRCLSD